MAIHKATGKVLDKAKRIAAHLLEAAEDDVEFASGTFSVKGSPEAKLTIQEIALATFAAHNLPDGMEPTLDSDYVYDPENFSFPHGTHLCAVEIDTETGHTKIRKYVCVDDIGKIINPVIVEGQIHGGLAQGIAQALYEEAVYDAEGNLVTGSLVDYLVPAAPDLPHFTTGRTETPATSNPLGVKGVGEAGTIASTPAVINAVVDALRPYGVNDIDMPATPERVWRALNGDAPRGPPRARSPTAARPPAAPAVRQHRRPRRQQGGLPVIPAQFDYVAPDSVARRDRRAGAGRGRQGARRRAEPAAGAAAAAVVPDDARRPAQGRGAARGPRGRRQPGHRRDDQAQPTSSPTRWCASTRHWSREATATVADPAVRHRGTFGGALAHADPAGDLAAVAVALDAQLVAEGPGGRRSIAASEFFQDYLQTALSPDELLVEVRIPKLEGTWGVHYEKFNRVAQAWAIVGAAVAVRRENGSIAEARVGLTNMGSTPVRPTAVEDALRGAPAQAGAIAEAAAHAADGTTPPEDLGGKADYRRHLAQVLTRRAVTRAAGL